MDGGLPLLVISGVEWWASTAVARREARRRHIHWGKGMMMAVGEMGGRGQGFHSQPDIIVVNAKRCQLRPPEGKHSSATSRGRTQNSPMKQWKVRSLKYSLL